MGRHAQGIAKSLISHMLDSMSVARICMFLPANRTVSSHTMLGDCVLHYATSAMPPQKCALFSVRPGLQKVDAARARLKSRPRAPATRFCHRLRKRLCSALPRGPAKLGMPSKACCAPRRSFKHRRILSKEQEGKACVSGGNRASLHHSKRRAAGRGRIDLPPPANRQRP